MNIEEIETALNLAQCEIRANYIKLGIKNSNVLDLIGKAHASVKKFAEAGVKAIVVDGSKLSMASMMLSSIMPGNHPCRCSASGWDSTGHCTSCGGVLFQTPEKP